MKCTSSALWGILKYRCVYWFVKVKRLYAHKHYRQSIIWRAGSIHRLRILTNINKYESPNESPPAHFLSFSWADIFVSLIVVSPGNKLSGNPLPRPVAAKGRWSDFMARDWEMALCVEKRWWFTITNVPSSTELLCLLSLPDTSACTIMHNALMAVFHNCQRSCG